MITTSCLETTGGLPVGIFYVTGYTTVRSFPFGLGCAPTHGTVDFGISLACCT